MMECLRRAVAVLLVLALPLGLTLGARSQLQADPPRTPPAQAAPLPQGAGGGNKVLRGGAQLPAQPVIEDSQNPATNDALTFPTDRKAKRSIVAAEEFIHEESWGEAARVLQALLDSNEDVFIEVERNHVTQWTSLRREANRLLGSMPAKGREFYELQYGARAKARLQEAKQKNDPQILAEVAQRYQHTEAGAEATDLLATYYLDRGNYLQAALCFERFLESSANDVKQPAPILFKAALAFRRAGNTAEAERLWKQLTAQGANDGLTLGNQNIGIKELRQELDREVVDRGTASYDWPMFKGNPSRSAQANGSTPLLEVKWTRPMCRTSQTEHWIKEAISKQEDRQQPALSGYFPIATTVLTKKETLPLFIYRSYFGIDAVDLRTGQLFWEAPAGGAAGSLDKIAEHPDQSAQLMQWLPYYQQHNPDLILQNGTVGTLSSDDKRVYMVDDLVLPPHPMSPLIQQQMFGGQANFGPLQDAVYHSSLQAYDLATGKFLWELGGHGPDGGALTDTYFLGPPLPLAGKLYVLTEKSSELRLVCLDAQKGELSWAQPLANMRDRLLTDVGRRLRGINLSFGDGILICPTNAGAILGVDLLSHSLVWEHSYREETAAPDQMGLLRRGMPGGMGFGYVNQNLSSDWQPSAPIIQDDKVVFTAPDGPSIHCLNLRNDEPIWKQSRADDLYLAGVYDGKVVLVGRTSCRALSLEDGRQLWNTETGVPSGQGVASDNQYYLPLKSGSQSKEPEICVLDLNTGAILAHTRSRKKEVPGNLLFYEGDVLSQTALAVSAFPQLKVRLAQIDQALQKDPNDPVGLTDRGELKLDKGDLAGAAQDLRTALAHKPPAEVMPRTRAKLFEVLTDLLQHDFKGHEEYLDQYKDLCQIEVPPDASAEERQRLEQEQERRQANYLCLLAKGREQEGRLREAFQAYLDFGNLTGNKELVSVVDQPDVKARPDIWARGRLAAMLAKAPIDQRQPLEEKISQQWHALQSTKDLDALRRFVTLFGSLSQAGEQARLELANRLMEQHAFLDAEQQLMEVRTAREASVGARAVELLARLMVSKELFEDAAYWYQLLGRDYASVPVRDGKTGATLLQEARADKRLQPFLEEAHSPWTGRFLAREINGTFPPQWAVSFEPNGEVLPFFQRNRLMIQGGTQLKLLDQSTNEERWSQMLQGYNHTGMGSGQQESYVQGHLVVFSLGQSVYCIDPVDPKVPLWQKELAGSSLPQQYTSHVRNNLRVQMVIENSMNHTKEIGAVGPGYVCLHSREGLMALDPLRGTVLWSRANVPLWAEVFGDDRYVYWVEVRNDHQVGSGHAIRAQDGVSVDVPDFGPLYRHRVKAIGGKLLVSETSPSGGSRLRLIELASGKDLWKKDFSADALVLNAEEPELTGVVERDGKVTLVDLHSYHELVTALAHPKSDLDKVQQVHLYRDKERFYLAFQKPSQLQANVWAVPNQNLGPGLHGISVNGPIYAFERDTGKLSWFNSVSNQFMVLDQFQQNPLLIFTTRYFKIVNMGGINRGTEQVTATRSIEKRTGRLVYDKENRNNYHQPFSTLVINQQAGTIDLISLGLKIQHYQEVTDKKGSDIK